MRLRIKHIGIVFILLPFMFLGGLMVMSDYAEPSTEDMQKLSHYADTLHNSEFDEKIHNAYADGKLTKKECDELNRVGRRLKNEQDKVNLDKKLRTLSHE